MRVLLVTQYFFPETGATSNRLLSLAKGLQAAGHEVAVVAEKPNHPEGVIRSDYRDGFFTERCYEGVPVIYTWVYTRPQKDFKTRLLFYLSFMLTAILGSRRAQGPFDVVLASSPPLFVGVAGWVAAWLKNARFVFDVRDLWPDVAVAMGALDNPALIRAARFLERFLYKQADGVTAVTDSFCQHIEALTRSEKPLARVMNGTVPEVFQQEEAGRRLRSELDLDDAFVVAYAGNHGEAQGLAHVLGAAAHLQKGASGVHFLMVGSGPVKRELIEKAQQQGLTNVQFRARVPLKEAGAHMAAADALLVPLARHEIYQQFIPSKLFDSMAAGRPVLLSVSGEARTILEEAGGGRYYPAEDGPALAEQILWLRDHPEACREMGRRGQDYALRHCTREAQAEKLVRFLEDRVADDRSA